MKKRVFLLVSWLCLMVMMVQAGKLETIKVDTRLIPGPMEVNVITPEIIAPGDRLPVVYLLNGYSGNNNDWARIIQPRLTELADKYRMILVMPDGRDSWYWDAPARSDMKMETFITKQLVPYIDAKYPTIPDAKHRAITGLSMGGHGALWLAIRHSDIFGSAGSMSGGVDIRPFAGKWKTNTLLGDPATNKQRYADYTVINLVPTLKPGQINIIFDCGNDDFFADVNENLHKALLQNKIPHDYISRPGNHSHAYWANSILYHLLFFNEQFNKSAK